MNIDYCRLYRINEVFVNACPALQVAGHVADAVSKGGKVLAGGGRAEMAGALVGGNFFAPTVIAEASIDMWVRVSVGGGPCTQG